jgi:hypothetical protein
MSWDEVVERVLPSVVKIETPGGHGTGFLCFYNETRTICGIATAHHVVEHADIWQQPIRISNFHSNTTTFLKEGDRVIWVDKPKDSAVVLVSTGQLNFPEVPIQLLPPDRRLPIGREVGWLGYPAIAAYTACFFSGNVSALEDWRNAYLIDGVAINGVSGGPVIYSDPRDGVQIVGAISAYRANRATGEVLPGLSIAQDVAHFQAMAAAVRDIDDANRQREALQAEQQPQQAQQRQQAEPAPAPAVDPPAPAEPIPDNNLR